MNIRLLRSGATARSTALLSAAAVVVATAFLAAPRSAHGAELRLQPGVRAETAGVHETSTRRARSSRSKKPVRRRAARIAAAPRVLGWTSPRGAESLRGELGAMLHAQTRSGRWGAIIVSLSRGDTLFAENADAMLQPASTMKLMTSAVALDRFGPDHQFTTDLLRDGLVQNGVVEGNLYLRGGGDPSFSTRFLRPGEAPPMDSLARLAYAAGVRRIHGDVVGDASVFDDERIPAGWQTRYLSSSYAAPVSALSVNENLMWIVVQPAGKSAQVSLEPATSTIPLVNKVRVVGGRGGRISAIRHPDGSIEVRGTVGASSGPLKYSYVINDPASYAAGALRTALEQAGIKVDGTVRMGRTPQGAQRVAALPSQPLARIVSVMNRESINHFAELLYRDAAHATYPSEPGSAHSGLRTLREFLAKKAEIDTTRIVSSDGSGLSVNDSVTARTMVELLGYAHRAPWGSSFHASLPVAGESELLRRRMRYTPAQGNLHAKTGTTNTVAALAGYVTAKDGEVIAFSFMYNGTDRWNAKATMDRMGATLAEFVR